MTDLKIKVLNSKIRPMLEKVIHVFVSLFLAQPFLNINFVMVQLLLKSKNMKISSICDTFTFQKLVFLLILFCVFFAFLSTLKCGIILDGILYWKYKYTSTSEKPLDIILEIIFDVICFSKYINVMSVYHTLSCCNSNETISGVGCLIGQYAKCSSNCKLFSIVWFRARNYFIFLNSTV